jgi:hypothetical protein
MIGSGVESPPPAWLQPQAGSRMQFELDERASSSSKGIVGK